MGRKKKEIKMKEPVRIREKRLNDGNVSLYLDIYYRGARKKEGLKLYLVPESVPLRSCKMRIPVSWRSKSRHSAYLTFSSRGL
jgi:hypothetical protein